MKKVLIGLVVLIGLFAGFVAMQPATYHVERTATVPAPPDVAFAQVNDLHAWSAWSPFEKLDPAAKKTYDGAPYGTGAGYAWSGNDKAGEGRMTITASKAPENVDLKIEFLKPFASTAQIQFSFKPVGNDTQVTWAMSGDNGFMGKAMSVFMGMDKMIGKDFDEGLSNLKVVAQAEVKKRADAAKSAAAAAAPADANTVK